MKDIKLAFDLWSGGLPCLKQVVKALIVADYAIYYGDNRIKNPNVKTCPRKNFKPGERYDLCELVCKQDCHAEVAALKSALGDEANLKSATLYMTGHTYICGSCLDAMAMFGVHKGVAIDTGLWYTYSRKEGWEIVTQPVTY